MPLNLLTIIQFVTGLVDDRERAARRRVTTRAQDNRMQTSQMRNRTRLAERTAAQTIGLHGRSISGQTVRNRLREHGIRARRQYVGSVLTPRHRATRLNWCTLHRNWTRQQWSRVMFSDESRFNLQTKDGRDRVYRRRGERFSSACVKSVNKFQPSVMVWGGITSTHKLDLVVIRGNLNADRYVDNVIRPVVTPFVNQHRDVIFQQDNARLNVARRTMQYLRDNNINVLEWPACSPDLSPIEHLWGELGRRVRRRLVPPRTIPELENALLEEWNVIPIHTITSLINSMRRRCIATINARGGHTRY